MSKLTPVRGGTFGVPQISTTRYAPTSNKRVKVSLYSEYNVYEDHFQAGSTIRSPAEVIKGKILLKIIIFRILPLSQRL